MHTKEQFELFMSQLKETNATLGFFCDFKKINSNVEDIAIKLETCGYMKSLLRTRVGKFKIEDENKVIDIENILENRIDIKNNDLSKLLNGVKLETKENNDLYNIYCDDKYIGIGEVVNNKLKRKIII